MSKESKQPEQPDFYVQVNNYEDLPAGTPWTNKSLKGKDKTYFHAVNRDSEYLEEKVLQTQPHIWQRVLQNVYNDLVRELLGKKEGK